MDKLKISLIAFPEAPKEIINRGETFLKNNLPKLDIEITDQNPDALFIITGDQKIKLKIY